MASKAKAKKTTAKSKKVTHEIKGNAQAAALRAKQPEELGEELLKLRKEQFALRMQRATGQAVKPDQFGKVRKNIARLKTVARERAIAEQKK